MDTAYVRELTDEELTLVSGSRGHSGDGVTMAAGGVVAGSAGGGVGFVAGLAFEGTEVGLAAGPIGAAIGGVIGLAAGVYLVYRGIQNGAL